MNIRLFRWTMLKSALLTAIAISVIALACTPGPAEAPVGTSEPDAASSPTHTPVPSPSPTPRPTFAEVVSGAKESVVRIVTDDGSSGSGTAIGNDGYIITNSHVVSGSRIITVFLGDGGVSQAEMIGLDVDRDIALLKISDLNIIGLTLANSSLVEEGDEVIALGFALDLPGTVSITSGVVSAFRDGDIDDLDYIQTDAALNPGNSGGPLINLEGDVVGMNTFGLSGEPGIEGVGFAVSSNVLNVSIRLLKTGLYQSGESQYIWDSYTNPEYGYSLTLAPEWTIDDTEMHNVRVESDGSEYADFLITAMNLSGNNLEQFADKITSFRLSTQNKELHFISRSEINLDDGNPAIRLEYRIQAGPDYCMERLVSVLTLVDNRIGIELISAVCEGGQSRLTSQLESMQMSFTP
jgi:S1-C subfamily serine protease